MSESVFGQQWEDSLSKPFDEALVCLRDPGHLLFKVSGGVFDEYVAREPGCGW